MFIPSVHPRSDERIRSFFGIIAFCSVKSRYKKWAVTIATAHIIND